MQQQKNEDTLEQKQDTVRLEEYLCFVQDTARITDRRQALTTACITVNGILVGIFTFFLGNDGVKGWWQIWLTLPILIMAGLICWYWIVMIRSYRLLTQFRFRQLEAMEKHLPGSHQMYTLEGKELYSEDSKMGKLGFSRTEKWLPVILMIGYIALFILLVISKLVSPV